MIAGHGKTGRAPKKEWTAKPRGILGQRVGQRGPDADVLVDVDGGDNKGAQAEEVDGSGTTMTKNSALCANNCDYIRWRTYNEHAITIWR